MMIIIVMLILIIIIMMIYGMRGQTPISQRRPTYTVSSHNSNSHSFKLRVSNPRPIAFVHLNMPFESSNLAGSGPNFPDGTFENWL